MNITKQLVKKILETPLGFDWSIQGLGMLRLYLSDNTRLHVWTHTTIENVTTIHTHPWDFKSTVIAGCLRNIIYKEDMIGSKGFASEAFVNPTHARQQIKCGANAYVTDEKKATSLKVYSDKIITEGYDYSQWYSNIHESLPREGTVTIVERTFKPDTEHAYVYVPIGRSWVSAEPRKATDEEILAITRVALEKYFKS